MIRIAEGPTAADRHEARISDLGEDHGRHLYHSTRHHGLAARPAMERFRRPRPRRCAEIVEWAHRLRPALRLPPRAARKRRFWPTSVRYARSTRRLSPITCRLDFGASWRAARPPRQCKRASVVATAPARVSPTQFLREQTVWLLEP